MAKKEIELKDIESIGNKKLSQLMYSEIANNKELYKKIEKMVLSSNPKELVKAIKRDIASIRRGSKFIDYYASFEFAQKVQNIVDNIVLNVEDKQSAAKLFKELVLTDSKVYLRSDDSSGIIQSSYLSAREAWLSCVDVLSDEEIYNDIKEMLVCEGFGTRDIFSESIPKTVLERLYDEYLLLENHKEIDLFDRICLLKDTAHYLKEPKKYEDAVRLNREELYDSDIINIATEYQYANQPKKILEILHSIDSIDTYKAKDFYSLQVCAYTQLNEPLNVTLAYKNWYEKSKSVEALKLYLEKVEGEMYEKVKNEALTYAQTLSLGEALNFFFELDEKQLAANYIFTDKERFMLQYIADTQLKKVIKWLEKEYPQETILLYRGVCEQALATSISKHYPRAIKALKATIEIEKKHDISSWKIEENALYLSTLLEKHKKKSKFLQLFEKLNP